jgi:hypothetical protein
MMKHFFTGVFILLMLSSAFGQQNSSVMQLEKVREQFFGMKNEKDGALNLYFRLKPLDLSTNPLLKAYRGAASAASAGSVEGVYRKLQYFNTGKSELEEAVKASPSNPEIRFLRLATQVNAPGFLGYNKDIESDKKMLINTFSSMSGTEPNAYLYYRIAGFMLDLKVLNQQEQIQITKFRKTVTN